MKIYGVGNREDITLRKLYLYDDIHQRKFFLKSSSSYLLATVNKMNNFSKWILSKDQLKTSSCTKSSSKPETNRNGIIDLFRIFAACAIIWFHIDATPFKNIAYSGLVFFLIISVVFQKNSAENKLGLNFLRQRSTRLLLPWAAWFLIYGLLNLIKGKPFFPYTSNFLQNILYGPWFGLWFLPYCFVSAFIVYELQRISTSINILSRFYFSYIIALFTLVAVSLIRVSYSPLVPWAQWLQAIPSIPIGLTMIHALAIPQSSIKRLLLLQLGISVGCASLFFIDPSLSQSYGIGSLLTTIGLIIKRNPFPKIAKLSSLCLGVYLIQGVVMSGLRFVPWVAQTDYGKLFLLTVTISFAMIALIKRIFPISSIV